MIIEFDEYKSKLNGIKPNLEGLGRALKLDDTRAEIASLEAESTKEGFWNDVNNSQKVQKRLKQLIPSMLPTSMELKNREADSMNTKKIMQPVLTGRLFRFFKAIFHMIPIVFIIRPPKRASRSFL